MNDNGVKQILFPVDMNHPPRSRDCSDSPLRVTPSKTRSSVLEGVLQSIDSRSRVPSTPATPTSPSSDSDTSRPTVVMGEDGAEVTLVSSYSSSSSSDYSDDTSSTRRNLSFTFSKLDLQQHSTTSRDATLNDVRTNSLLDDDNSPSPNKIQSSAMCCSAVRLCNSSETSAHNGEVFHPQRHVERNISLLLGKACEDGFCGAWQAWSYLGTALTGAQPKETPKLKQDIRSVLRNRACDMNARISRIQKLRRDLSPFEEGASTPPTKPSRVERARSFNAKRHTPPTFRPKPTTSKPSSSFASVWESVQSCTTWQPQDSPVMTRREFTVLEDQCYDSDPEDFIRRTSTRSRTRRKLEKESEAYEESSDESSPSQIAALNISVLEDDEILSVRVQEFINKTNTLILHKRDGTSSALFFSPVAVKLWVERGQRLKRRLIQPKIAWQVLQQRRGRPSPETVELLDVTRVFPVDKVNRHLYPLAKRKNVFWLKTLHEPFLFEAGSEKERDYFVTALKLLVARFGSKIIVADDSVFDEYFAPSTGL